MSYHQDDTIAARATPPGVGGIAVLRLSGAQAKAVLARIFVPRSPRFVDFIPWTLHRGRVLDSTDAVLDDVLAVFMPGPSTFTGEDVAEIHCHGGPAIAQGVLEALLAHGVRLAERGEFSRRALRNGRMDLTQAEAVAEIIAAASTEALRLAAPKLDGVLGQRVGVLREALEKVRRDLCVAVDFPEEDIECLAPADFIARVGEVIAALDTLGQGYARARSWQEGASVVLAGAVNAGKSSLMNALLGHNRALVTNIPGTTRDFLEETLILDGLPVRLTDTAGLRLSDDAVERMGIAHSRERIERADVLVCVLDGALGVRAAGSLDAALTECGLGSVTQMLCRTQSSVLLVWNKVDIAPEPCIPDAWSAACAKGAVCVPVSALHGAGLEALCACLRATIVQQGGGEPEPGAPNTRQATALARARDELEALCADIDAGQPYDICAVRLDAACAFLGEVTGLDTPAAVLDSIFSTFCIGK